MKPRILFLLTLLWVATASLQSILAYDVTNTNDSGPGSLRDGVFYGGVIFVDEALSGQGIRLTNGEISIYSDLFIFGPAGSLTVDGQGASRVFRIYPGSTVTLSGLNITNGVANTPASEWRGGGIYNQGVLTINKSAVAGNSAGAQFGNNFLGSGGGIYNRGVLTINNSTFQENRTGISFGGDGGAIYNEGESVTINNSTFYRNVASNGGGAGGAIRTDFGALTINNSTLSDNSSYLGGIYNRGDAVTTIKGTILKNTPLYYPLYYGITSLGYNLSNDSAGGLLTAIGDRINTDPMLDVRPLDNGGPTHTIALLPGSPAIDAGTDLTAVNGAIDDMTTGVSAIDATGIIAGVGFAIQIDSEQMIVDAKSGNTLTVRRGANGTTPAAHGNGAAVNPAFDQRDSGFARKVGSAVDIGAFEVQASSSPTPTPSPTATTTAPPNDFSISVSPPSQTVVQGASTSYTVSTAVISGNPETIALSLSGLPNGASRSFTSNTITTGTSTTLTINAGTAASGTYFLTITGVGSVNAHSATAQLIVIAATTPTPTPTPTPTATPTPSYAAQIQQPINADGSSVFNVRRGVVPVSFTLTLNGVATCALPPATIAVTRTAGGTTGEIDESVYTGPADNGSNFRINSCQYIYNLSASALGAGTYRVDIIINGQVVSSATFALR